VDKLGRAGAYGFVDAVKELKKQLLEQNLKIDYIFIASSSGGTQAGLKLGIDLYELDIVLIPISIDKIGFGNKTLDEAVLELLHKGQKELNIQKNYSINDAKLIRNYDEPGYGVITQNEKMAIKQLAQKEGILLDPVYSGRAFYGMLDHLKNNRIEKNSNVLFWHTGGLPANFYYSEELLK
jgi:D-cysteine desulfhydrase